MAKSSAVKPGLARGKGLKILMHIIKGDCLKDSSSLEKYFSYCQTYQINFLYMDKFVFTEDEWHLIVLCH